MTTVSGLQVRYPDRITLIRGNHESRQITQVRRSWRVLLVDLCPVLHAFHLCTTAVQGNGSCAVTAVIIAGVWVLRRVLAEVRVCECVAILHRHF